MRKKRWTALAVCMLLMLCAATALANSWGLKGDLFEAVSADSRWNDYTTYGKQSGDAAVMQSRYHNALMLVEDGELRVYTTAVWQPDDDVGVPRLGGGDGETLLLAYGEEEFCFSNRDGAVMRLEWAKAGEISVHYGVNGYVASDGEQTMILQRDFRLQDFNIRLFPRRMYEVQRLNRLYAKLDSGSNVLGWAEDGQSLGSLRSGLGKGTAPVYSAPFGASAWRAAKGKASVGLKGDVWLLGCMTNQDGETYACIRYEVSQRTQRIGYVKASALSVDLSGWEGSPEDLISVQAYAAADTFLTDDPLCSQFAQFTVPAGTSFTCMGMLNDDYAYVAAEVRDGRFTDGGEILWGFVPLKDLMYKAMPDNAEAMAAATGYWHYAAGGSMQADSLHLRSDGTFIANMGSLYFAEDEQSLRGTWYLSRYADSENLYWNDPPYEITFLYEDGRCVVRGFTMDGEDAFSLTNWEGGGGYERVPDGEADTQPRPAGDNG